MEKKREKQDKNKENKKKQKNQQWILIMIYYIMFAVCGAVGMMYVEEIRGEDAAHNLLIGEISVILCVIVVFLLHIIIHEAGHFVFGLLSGYRFSSFRIGNIMFIKKNGKLQVKKFSVMGTGGQCLMVPPECSWEQLPYRLYNLGGPLMNILFSVAAWGVCIVAKDNLYVKMFCTLFSIVGVGAALANGIPIFGQINNDGANAWSLGKNPEALRCFAIQMKINARITEEVRLKDMPEEWFQMPSQKQMEQDALCSAMGMLALNRAIDQKDFKKAKEIVEQLLKIEDSLILLYKNLFTTERIFLELISKKKEKSEEEEQERKQLFEKLQEKEYKKFASAMKQNPSLVRMQYAYALLEENNEKEAEKYLSQFQKVAKTYPNQCEIEGEEELLVIAKNTYERRKCEHERKAE